ncbi:MAG: 16S rRNA processing protein RimM [Coriobacteriales bacterium]|jgi:16S rRNA processing protein RimM|nr:16S rRNA processing protein RimM [Coriobacteriales bacterium]
MNDISAVTGYRRIARISRAKGLAGEVTVVAAVELPVCAWEGLQLWVVPPAHRLIRTTHVRSAVERGAELLLTLEGVVDRTTAQRLQGKYLLARVDDLAATATDVSHADVTHAPGVESHKDAHGLASLKAGVEVTDEVHGYLGSIVEVRPGSAQALLVIEGPFGEVLVPAVDEFIRSCDGKAACVRLPSGLLELNA